MSFILDALRKSEHERQRQLGPSIAELPVARPAPRVPPWVWVALAALLTLNIAVVGWFLTRPDDAPAPPPAPPAPAGATPGQVAEAPLAAPAPVSAVPAAPTSAPPATQLQQVETTPAVVPDSTAPTAAVREVRPLAEEAYAEPPAVEPVFTAPEAPDPALLPAPPMPAARGTPVTAGVPTIDQLPPQATAGLPPLSIDLHIYANQPAQRAVFINGTRYREGERLTGGAVVQQITPDGAVISYGGQRFLLPRQ
jgi:general secretion pathway protein B